MSGSNIKKRQSELAITRLTRFNLVCWSSCVRVREGSTRPTGHVGGQPRSFSLVSPHLPYFPSDVRLRYYTMRACLMSEPPCRSFHLHAISEHMAQKSCESHISYTSAPSFPPFLLSFGSCASYEVFSMKPGIHNCRL